MLARGSILALLAVLAVTALAPGQPDATPRRRQAASGSRHGVLPFLRNVTHVQRHADAPAGSSRRPRGGTIDTITDAARYSVRWWTETLTPTAPGSPGPRRPEPHGGVSPSAPAAVSGLRMHGGRIDTTVEAAATIGLPGDVLAVVTDALRGPLDLQDGFPAGASIRVVYDADTRGAPDPPRRQIVAARVAVADATHETFCLGIDGAAAATCFTRDGVRLGRGVLRYPVDTARITSGFSASRYHPVLKRWAPHWGVDFAAPQGTPVRAVAGGVVERAGWRGSSGLAVRIRHDETYVSSYAHLSRIATAIDPGTAVRDGQVIGYVGSTGRTTGAHLHFALSRHGAYIDPLGEHVPQLGRLAGGDLDAFRTVVTRIDAAFGDDGAAPRRLAALATEPARTTE